MTLVSGRASRIVLAIGGVIAALRIGRGLERLLFPTHDWDAGDLGMRWREVHAWFDGLPVYGQIPTADYPPGSYPVFWLFIGWADFGVGRWIWAASTLALLGALVWLLVRESRTSGGPLRVAVLLLPLVGYATYSTIVNGQASILVVASLTAGVLMLVRSRTWRGDIAGSLLVAVSLIKPTVSIPVAWIALLTPRRIRPAALMIVAYLALTLVAVAFQPAGLVDLIRGWLDQSGSVNMAAASGLNLQKLLASTGLEHLFLPAVLSVGIATGAWVYRYRNADVWLLLGVTSIVALLWTYHRPYDDMLMLLPTVALVRLAVGAPERRERLYASVLAWALILLALEHPQLLRPGRTHGLLVTDIEAVVFALANLRSAAWLAALVFLVREAHRTTFPRPAAASPDAATENHVALDDIPAVASADGDRRRRFIVVFIGLPLIVLAGMFGWLVLEHRSAALWNLVVNGTGPSTFGQTVLSFRLFLREIPTALAMALFLVSVYDVPAGDLRDRRTAKVSSALAAITLAAAALLIVTAVAIVSIEYSPGEAARNLSQLYIRDDVQAAFGSYWRLQLPGTLWFGLAAPVAAWIGYRIGGPPSRGSSGSVTRLVAWSYFVGLTIVFGIRFESSLDSWFVWHQAREILTHATVTLPLGLGLLAAVHRVTGLDAREHASGRPTAAHIAGVVAIPAYFAVMVFASGAIAAGSAGRGLSAMLAAHFFEHAFGFALVFMLVVGLQASRAVIARRPASRVAGSSNGADTVAGNAHR
jgi:hypothetical protein